MQILINILFSSFMLFCVALSFCMIYQVTKFFHIAHAITITIVAYFLYLFSEQLEFSLWIAVPLAISLATIVGILSEVCIYRPLRKRGASSMMLLIASIGLYTSLQNCISMIYGDDTKSIRVGEVKVGHQFFGAYITDIQIITIVVSVMFFILCVLFLKYHKIGRNIRAVSSNPELCNVVGINSDKVILWAFGIGSALAAVAGILVAFDTDMTPTMGFNLLLYGVVVMIIGGIGSTWGLLGGALLLATAQHLAAYYIGSQWMNAIAYIILILFLLWKPLGFSGKRLKKVEI